MTKSSSACLIRSHIDVPRPSVRQICRWDYCWAGKRHEDKFFIESTPKAAMANIRSAAEGKRKFIEQLIL